jgi:hypothetical protein
MSGQLYTVMGLFVVALVVAVIGGNLTGGRR